MKKLIIVFSMLIAMNANAQWVWQYTASQYSLLYSMKFTSENTGYAVGGRQTHPKSVFLKTTNGGTNWVDLNIFLPLEPELLELSFVNDNTGYICGYFHSFYKTTNGGLNWDSVQVPFFGNQIWNSLQFLNANTGFIAGRYGMRSKTTNGGINWISMDTTGSDIFDIYFLNATTGFMAESSSTILRTTNGGSNWTSTVLLDTIGGYYAMYKIDFSNNNTGYLVGGNTINGAIFKTTDNGNTWKNILITPNGLFCIKVVNVTNLYVTSLNNIVLNSTNSGITWNNQIVPTTTGTMTSIYFTNNTTGYLTVGNEIYKTTNGGVGIVNISIEIPKEFKLFQNYPNPFNNSTNIIIEIKEKDFYKLEIYDVSGRKVDNLLDGIKTPGTYQVNYDASKLSSGIYFYKLFSSKYLQTKKFSLIK